MGIVLIIISIVLIIVSLLLLIITPLALIGVAIGIAGIIIGIKQKSIKPTKTQKEPERSVKEFSQVFEIIDVDAESLEIYISDREDLNPDITSMYDRGEKIFKYQYDFSNISVEGNKVLVNGHKLGNILQNAVDFISDHADCRFNISAEYGEYADIVKNPDADYDYEDNILKYGEITTPEVLLYVIYKE